MTVAAKHLARFSGVALTLTLFAGHLPAQEYNAVNPYLFLHLTKESGLASENVVSITQDENGFWWFGTDDGLQRFDGANFLTFRHRPGDSTSIVGDIVQAVFMDKQHWLWIASDMGICRYDPGEKRFFASRLRQGAVPVGFPSRFFEDSAGNLWFLTAMHGLFRLDTGASFWEAVPIPGNHKTVGMCMSEDTATGDIWFATLGGIAYYERATGMVRHAGTHPNSHPVFSKAPMAGALLIDDGNNLWVGMLSEQLTGLGILKYNLSSGASFTYPEDIPNNAFVFQGRDGHIWLFSERETALGRYDPASDRFLRYFMPEGIRYQLEIEFEGLRHVFEDREGNIWIAASTGAFMFNPNTQQIRRLPAVIGDKGAPELLQFPLSFLETANGEIWVGTYFRGLYVFDRQFRFLRRYIYPVSKGGLPQDRVSQNYNAVWALLQDSRGRIWAGGQHGILQLFSAEGKLLRKWQPEELKYKTIHSIAEDEQGSIWIGNRAGDLARWSEKEQRFVVAANLASNGMAIPNLISDKNGRIWAVAGNRLACWEIASGQYCEAPPDNAPIVHGISEWNDSLLLVFGHSLYFFNKNTRTFSEARGVGALPSRQIAFAVKSSERQVWLGTNGGFVQWDPETGQMIVLNQRDGLPVSQFKFFSPARRLRDGRILAAAGKEGLFFFHPDSLHQRRPPPDVLITGLKLFDRPLDRPPKANAEEVLFLRRQENFLTVEFVCLSWLQQNSLSFQYRIRGVSNTWVSNGTRQNISITSLPPGNHVLEIRAVSREGLFSAQPATLRIRVWPPWWRSRPAIAAYIASLGGIFYLFFRFRLKRKLQAAEARRLRELDAFKTNFYTNITHEFRTPLTIISGMADQIGEQPENWLHEGLRLIKRNSNRLLDLVNQMLDLSKLESGRMPLHLQQADIIIYLKYLLESFHSLAQSKQIQLQFQSDMPVWVMDFDAEKVRQVLSNLMSNALKFTPAGGQVQLSVAVGRKQEAETLFIKVSDTGPGIAPEKLPYIFDRFYQADDSPTRQAEGSGIGLALAKELVKRMGGEISVQSPDPGSGGRGTAFTVALPVSRKAELAPVPLAEALPVEQKGAIVSEAIIAKGDSTARPYILVVEDNADVVQYLAACLAADYRMTAARNGREGIDMAIETVPDLVITDVMMPDTDGFELCRTLKNDARSSHIPIIMLTARAGIENKIEGLKHGADDYLIKPFHKTELLTRIEQLLDLRRKLQQHYLAAAGLHDAEPPARALLPEDSFVQKVRAVVEAHLADYDFSVDQLCREVYMSHSQLHRKMTALTGCAPALFIRKVRLQHAKPLLLNPETSITAVALETGFEDPGYFTRVFKKEFGLSPGAWRKQQ